MDRINRLTLLLGLVLSTQFAFAQDTRPTLTFTCYYDRADNQFSINIGRYNTPRLRFYLYLNKDLKFFATNYTCRLYWSTEQIVSQITPSNIWYVVGTTASNYVDFLPATTNFVYTSQRGYAVITLANEAGERYSFARGDITIRDAPEF